MSGSILSSDHHMTELQKTARLFSFVYGLTYHGTSTYRDGVVLWRRIDGSNIVHIVAYVLANGTPGPWGGKTNLAHLVK